MSVDFTSFSSSTIFYLLFQIVIYLFSLASLVFGIIMLVEFQKGALLLLRSPHYAWQTNPPASKTPILLGIFFWLLITVITAELSFPDLNKSIRETIARQERVRCTQNLVWVTAALQSYQEQYKTFPPDLSYLPGAKGRRILCRKGDLNSASIYTPYPLPENGKKRQVLTCSRHKEHAYYLECKDGKYRIIKKEHLK